MCSTHHFQADQKWVVQLQFHPFSVHTPLESMKLLYLLLVSLTVMNGIHTWLVNIYVHMYECVYVYVYVHMCICIYILCMYVYVCMCIYIYTYIHMYRHLFFLSVHYHYPARLLFIVSLLSYLDFCCIICILCVCLCMYIYIHMYRRLFFFVRALSLSSQIVVDSILVILF